MLIAGTSSALIHDGDLPGPRGFTWGFIALEYYALILNRVMGVLFTSHYAVIVRVGDVVAAPTQVTEAHYDPLAYVTGRMARRYKAVAAESDEVLRIDRVNRRVPLSSIIGSRFEPRKKWGMGSVPYSGLVYLTQGSEERQFILLGNQDGNEIAARLRETLHA